MSESARDVGLDTLFLGITATCVYHLSEMGSIETLRRLWLKDGAPRRCKQTIGAIKDLLYTDKEAFLDIAVMERALKYIQPYSLKRGIRRLIEARKKREALSTPPALDTSADQQ